MNTVYVHNPELTSKQIQAAVNRIVDETKKYMDSKIVIYRTCCNHCLKNRYVALIASDNTWKKFRCTCGKTSKMQVLKEDQINEYARSEYNKRLIEQDIIRPALIPNGNKMINAEEEELTGGQNNSIPKETVSFGTEETLEVNNG